LLLAICTVFVAIPGALSLLSFVLLLVYGDNHVGARGLLGAAGVGVFSVPFAILQIIAVAKPSGRAAALVSAVCWCIFALLSIGIVQLLVVGSDDKSELRMVPEGIVLLAILGMNSLTAIIMGRYSREILP
jgi:hypothetical protein